jgi:hypothetical protein
MAAFPVQQIRHGFHRGQPIRREADKWVLATDGAWNAVVSRVTGDNTFEAADSGVIEYTFGGSAPAPAAPGQPVVVDGVTIGRAIAPNRVLLTIPAAQASTAVAEASRTGSVSWSSVTGKPTQFPALPHATTHKHGGVDEIAVVAPLPHAIPKANASAKLDDWVTRYVIDVKLDHGAKGDNATDDTAAIQAAFVAANARGGAIVYFPPGTYVINNTITIYPRCVMQGSGQGQTLIRTKNNGVAAQFGPDTSARYMFDGGLSTDIDFFEAHDLSIKGTSINGYNGGVFRLNAAGDNRNCRFTGLYLYDLGGENTDAFNITLGTTTVLEGIGIDNAAGNAFRFNSCTSLSLNSCYANGVLYSGFLLSGCSYCALQGCGRLLRIRLQPRQLPGHHAERLRRRGHDRPCQHRDRGHCFRVRRNHTGLCDERLSVEGLRTDWIHTGGAEDTPAHWGIM